MNIFLNTSALIAWFNKKDKYHEEAQRILMEIRNGRIGFTKFITSDYVFDETLTFFESVLKDHELAVQVGEALLGSSYLYLNRVDPDVFESGWERFRESTGMSFTDCTSMVIMDRLGVNTVFTFDSHFKNAGYNQLA